MVFVFVFFLYTTITGWQVQDRKMDECEVLIQMLRHRGLKFPSSSVGKWKGPEGFKYHLESVVDGNPCAALLVDMHGDDQIGKKPLMQLIDDSIHTRHLIFVVCGLSPPAIEALEEFKRSTSCTKVEVILKKQLAWNKSKHVYVPNYEKLSRSQVEDYEVRHKLKVNKDTMPNMLTTDAMAVYFGFCEGDVVYAVEYDCYRIVVYRQKKSK